MDIFPIVFASLLLIVLLAFHYEPVKSRFELQRLAKHNRANKIALQFDELYPGTRNFVWFLALIVGACIVVFSYQLWNWLGVFAAVLIVIAALIIARFARPLSARLIAKHAAWFVKYFSWTNVLAKASVPPENPPIASKQELLYCIQSDSITNQDQRLLIEGALSFSDKTVDDIMVPRDDIVSVKGRDTLGPLLLDELHKTGHRVFPVVKNRLEHTIGTLYLDDVLPLKQENQTVSQAMRKPLPLVETGETLEVTLAHFMKYHCSQFIVVDEHQEIIGLVSINDIIDTLFGRNVTTE